MSLLPRHFRLERGDGAASAAAAVRALRGPGASESDGDLRQRDHCRPGQTATELIGRPVAEVTDDGSPQDRAPSRWEPNFAPRRARRERRSGAPFGRRRRRRMMADLVAGADADLRPLAPQCGIDRAGRPPRLADIAPHLRDTVASYRAGYLAEDRRALERALADGELRGWRPQCPLELGIDISGLDAVVLAGFPGPSPRSGSRPGGAGARPGALVLLVARDDPLDTYLVHHPDALLGKPVEQVVTDPRTPM